MPIDTLLGILHRMHYISNAFRDEITPFLTRVSVKKGSKLLELDKRVGFAWFLFTGFVIGRNERGNATRLCKDKQIITDFDGFFNGKLSVVELIAFTDCELLVLSREHYLILEAKYAETVKLKEHCFFLENAIEADRSDMLLKKPWDRFLHFADKYKFAFMYLPNRLCASFINVHEANFCKFKSRYFKKL